MSKADLELSAQPDYSAGQTILNQLLNDGDWFKSVWNAGQCHRIDAGSHGAGLTLNVNWENFRLENFAPTKTHRGGLMFSCVSADRKRRTVFVFLNQSDLYDVLVLAPNYHGAKGHSRVIGQANQVYNDMLRECITDLLEGNDGDWQ